MKHHTQKTKKITFTCFVILCLTNLVSFAQFSDLARIEYTVLPGNNKGETTLNKYRALINYPIKLNNKGSYLFVGADYKFITLDIDQNLIPFKSDELSQIKQLSFSLGYTFKINENWRFGAQIQPGYSTNLDIGDITFDDAVISGNIIFIKDKKKSKKAKKPFRLILGISISGNNGFPVLPFISYYRKFHPKWSYNLGVPKTQLQYYFSERNRLKLVVRIDGINSNLQNELSTGIDDNKLASRFRQRLILGGLQYEYNFTKNLEFYINGSYIIDNSIELRDQSRNTLFDFEINNSLYIKMGARFKL